MMSGPTLERAIGPAAATLIVIGGIIGSGIFLTTGQMAIALPSAAWIMAAWAAGGVLTTAGALSFAEMGAMFPRSGGLYVYLREAFGPLVAFLYGWASLLVILPGGTAAVAVGFAEYFNYFVPAVPRQVSAVGSIAILGAINYAGVRSGSGTAAFLTVAKVTGLVLLVGFVAAAPQTSPDFSWTLAQADLSPWVGFGLAMIAVLWAHDGYYILPYAAGELRDPGRTLPRALIIGILSVTGIYLMVNLAYFYALPMSEIRGTLRIAERAVTATVGSWGATMLAMTVLVSTLGANAAILLTASRLLYAMAADGLFFKVASAVHPRYRTPHIAVIILTVWSSVLALSGTYEQLFTYVVFTSVLFNLIGGVALFRLRRTQPQTPRPYRVWAYPILPALFVLGSVFIVVNTAAERPVQSLAGLGLLVAGLPAYWHWRRQLRSSNFEVRS
jgi:APA family basic amino acid/polyamine antiporter